MWSRRNFTGFLADADGRGGFHHGHSSRVVFVAACPAAQETVHNGYGNARGGSVGHVQGVGERYHHLTKDFRKALEIKYGVKSCSWCSRGGFINCGGGMCCVLVVLFFSKNVYWYIFSELSFTVM